MCCVELVFLCKIRRISLVLVAVIRVPYVLGSRLSKNSLLSVRVWQLRLHKFIIDHPAMLSSTLCLTTRADRSLFLKIKVFLWAIRSDRKLVKVFEYERKQCLNRNVV